MAITTTGTTTTTLDPRLEQLSRQRAVDTSLALLSYNMFPSGDGKTTNLLSQYDLPQLQAARLPYADQIRALANSGLSAAEVTAQANTIINQFRSQFPVTPTVTTTTTATQTVSADDKLAALYRQRAVEGQLAILSYNVFPGADGKAVNLGTKGLTAAQLTAARLPFVNQIKALATKQPPLTPAQIQTESSKIIASFRAQYGGAPVAGATSTTGNMDEAARRAAVDAALSQIRGIGTFSDGGETLDLMEMIGPEDVASERQEYEDRIRGLLTQQPPLSAEQITSAANGVIGEWKEAGAIIYRMVELMASMAMFGQMNMVNAMMDMGG